jgi:hypothetical protein
MIYFSRLPWICLVDSHLFKRMDGNAYLQELCPQPQYYKIIFLQVACFCPAATEAAVIVSCVRIPYNLMMVTRRSARQRPTRKVRTT